MKGAGDDYLFSPVYGDMMIRTSLQKSIVKYSTERSFKRNGRHVHRHTFIARSVEKNVLPLTLKAIT